MIPISNRVRSNFPAKPTKKSEAQADQFERHRFHRRGTSCKPFKWTPERSIKPGSPAGSLCAADKIPGEKRKINKQALCPRVIGPKPAPNPVPSHPLWLPGGIFTTEQHRQRVMGKLKPRAFSSSCPHRHRAVALSAAKSKNHAALSGSKRGMESERNPFQSIPGVGLREPNRIVNHPSPPLTSARRP